MPHDDRLRNSSARVTDENTACLYNKIGLVKFRRFSDLPINRILNDRPVFHTHLIDPDSQVVLETARHRFYLHRTPPALFGDWVLPSGWSAANRSVLATKIGLGRKPQPTKPVKALRKRAVKKPTAGKAGRRLGQRGEGSSSILHFADCCPKKKPGRRRALK